jgi:hypothetical protein
MKGCEVWCMENGMTDNGEGLLLFLHLDKICFVVRIRELENNEDFLESTID